LSEGDELIGGKGGLMMVMMNMKGERMAVQ
jgi:hypothetical protein